jgi:hypothetical protein
MWGESLTHLVGVQSSYLERPAETDLSDEDASAWKPHEPATNPPHQQTSYPQIKTIKIWIAVQS